MRVPLSCLVSSLLLLVAAVPDPAQAAPRLGATSTATVTLTLWAERTIPRSGAWNATVSVEQVRDVRTGTASVVRAQAWRTMCDVTGCVDVHTAGALTTPREVLSVRDRRWRLDVVVPMTTVRRRAADLTVLDSHSHDVRVAVTAEAAVRPRRHVVIGDDGHTTSTTTVEQGAATARITMGTLAWPATLAGTVQVHEATRSTTRRGPGARGVLAD